MSGKFTSTCAEPPGRTDRGRSADRARDALRREGAISVARTNKSFPVSWSELHRDTRALAWRLADLPPFAGIVAIARGGLVPAAIIARELDIRTIHTVCISSYDDRSQREPRILKALDSDGDGLLIIDDLVDTGVTARLVRAMLPKAHLATVYAKPAGSNLVDTFVTMVSQDTWILFPWDDARSVSDSRRGETAP